MSGSEGSEPRSVHIKPEEVERLNLAFAFTLLNLGRTREALGWADEAVVRAERFGQPALLSRALGLRVVLGFMSALINMPTPLVASTPATAPSAAMVTALLILTGP